MIWAGLSGEGALMESALLGLGPVNVPRARHDLRTLAGLLPSGVEDPHAQLLALGDNVAAGFTISSEPCFDVGRTLLERHGDEWVVAALVTAVGQGVGWDVAVIACEQRALVAHRVAGPPLALSIADEGRLIDVGDLDCAGQLRWHCPYETAAAIERRAA